MIVTNFSFKKEREIHPFAFFHNVISGVLQDSLLGPLLFKTFLTDIFLFCPTEIASHTDDSTPSAMGDSLKKLCKK